MLNTQVGKPFPTRQVFVACKEAGRALDRAYDAQLEQIAEPALKYRPWIFFGPTRTRTRGAALAKLRRSGGYAEILANTTYRVKNERLTRIYQCIFKTRGMQVYLTPEEFAPIAAFYSDAEPLDWQGANEVGAWPLRQSVWHSMFLRSNDR